LNQTNKPAAMTEEARKERVREVLRAASEPLSPIQIAERIGEAWCMWNGSGFGSAVTPLLRKIGAKKSSGKWSLKARPSEESGCAGDLMLSRAESAAVIRGLIDLPPMAAAIPIEPGHVMSRESYRRLVEQQSQQ